MNTINDTINLINGRRISKLVLLTNLSRLLKFKSRRPLALLDLCKAVRTKSNFIEPQYRESIRLFRFDLYRPFIKDIIESAMNLDEKYVGQLVIRDPTVKGGFPPEMWDFELNQMLGTGKGQQKSFSIRKK